MNLGDTKTLELSVKNEPNAPGRKNTHNMHNYLGCVVVVSVDIAQVGFIFQKLYVNFHI